MIEKKYIRAVTAAAMVMVVLVAVAVVYSPAPEHGDDVVSDGINYHGNGGSMEDGGTVHGSASRTVMDGASVFSWEGHVFTGWNTAADGSGTAYAEGDTVPGDGSARLYAQWAYALTIEWNQGTGVQTDLLYQLTNLEHEQVTLNGMDAIALPDSPWTTLSVIKAGTDWTVDNGSLTITGVCGDTTYTVTITGVCGDTTYTVTITGHDGADNVVLSTIDWQGSQFPLIILEYGGPVDLRITETVS